MTETCSVDRCLIKLTDFTEYRMYQLFIEKLRLLRSTDTFVHLHTLRKVRFPPLYPESNPGHQLCNQFRYSGPYIEATERSPMDDIALSCVMHSKALVAKEGYHMVSLPMFVRTE
jgi:hypothetical protein